MEGFSRVTFKLRRLKILCNPENTVGSGGISIPDTITVASQQEKCVVFNTRWWVASPGVGIPDRNAINAMVQRIQRDLVDDNTEMKVCGVLEGTLELEGTEEAIGRVLNLLNQHTKELGVLNEFFEPVINNFMERLGFSKPRWTLKGE
jgi:hypothetical protein